MFSTLKCRSVLSHDNPHQLYTDGRLIKSKNEQTGHQTERPSDRDLPILSYPVLSYPILSYPVLSCPNAEKRKVTAESQELHHMTYNGNMVCDSVLYPLSSSNEYTNVE